MFPTLLIPLALDVRDAELLAAAVTLVGTAGVKNVHLVYVHAMDVVGNPLLGGIPVETFTPAAPEGLAGLADELRERLTAAGRSDVSVHRHHMAGRPHERITALAGEIDADLLVFGRLRAGDGHEAWGAHAQLLTRYAHRSVLVVPHGSTLSLGDVRVGVDFSPRSLEACKTACLLGQEVKAIYSMNPDEGMTHSGITVEEFMLRLRANATQQFHDEVLTELAPGAVTPTLVLVETDNIVDTLLGALHGAGLAVVASRGMTAMASMLLGSTAQEIAGRADAPVLILRTKGEDMGLFASLLSR